MRKKPLTDESGEVRELTRADMRRMLPVAEVLPAELAALLPKRKRGQRGAQKAPTKTQVTLRLDRDVVQFFKVSGTGWQTRINRALRDTMRDAG